MLYSEQRGHLRHQALSGVTPVVWAARVERCRTCNNHSHLNNSSDRPPHKNANSVPGRLRGHGKPRPFRTAPGPFCTGGRPLSGGGAWCGAPANCREGGWRAGPAERRAQDVNGRSRSAAGSGRAGGVSAGLGEQAPQTGRERVKAGGGQRLPRGPPPVTQPLLWTTLTPPQLAPKPEAEEAK